MLQVFLRCIRTGRCARNGYPVRARAAEEYVRSVAQAFLAMGSPDPRLDSSGSINFCLQRQIKTYTQANPPPNQVKPVPISVLCRIMMVAHATTDPALLLATADMICIAFFFLLRPGEYAHSPSDSTPFMLESVQLFRGGHHLDLPNATVPCTDPHLYF